MSYVSPSKDVGGRICSPQLANLRVCQMPSHHPCQNKANSEYLQMCTCRYSEKSRVKEKSKISFGVQTSQRLDGCNSS